MFQGLQWRLCALRTISFDGRARQDIDRQACKCTGNHHKRQQVETHAVILDYSSHHILSHNGKFCNCLCKTLLHSSPQQCYSKTKALLHMWGLTGEGFMGVYQQVLPLLSINNPSGNKQGY